ncbi:hypothetical protein AVL50_11170 [Flammeovirga sp. SJP92]|nr:hypothetical protein AVL50_11170 [Flammeovirga sp. SJP92]
MQMDGMRNTLMFLVISTNSKLSNTNFYLLFCDYFLQKTFNRTTINTFFCVVLSKNKLELTMIYF